MQTIPAQEFCQRLKAGAKLQILDVRSRVEHRERRLRSEHVNVALSDIRSIDVRSLFPNKDEPIYIICRTDNRSVQAASVLELLGEYNIVVVKDGVVGSERCGAEMIYGQTISLERQVRMIAGGLVLLGSILAANADPIFMLLPAFVGAGLLIAGITDWCGMALLLTKAPWNR